MQVQILGSGAADGWPNPWCSCASCRAAREQGVLRGQTSVLVDGQVLLDLGADGMRAAARHGTSLAGVRLVLVGHHHPDHHHAMGWQWRSWAEQPAPVTLVAPPSVLEQVGTREQLMAIPAHPGGQHEVHGYEVRVAGAEHTDDAVLYDLTGPDGTRLLYATDTGVLPEQTVTALSGRAFDAVLLECTGTPIRSHLTLPEWADQVARLRQAGAITGRTQVLAIHLGHHNPPPDELDRRLAALGSRAVRDGEVIDTRRGRRVLVLGGQSSGKSAYAESLLTGAVTYVATAPRREGDDEWEARLAAHQKRRPATWTTVETGDVAAVLRQTRGPVLVDDLGLWLTGVLDDHWDSPEARKVFARALEELCAAWEQTLADIVLVAPEVGCGVVPATASGRLFADLLGRASTALAASADQVVQVIAGQPRRLR